MSQRQYSIIVNIAGIPLGLSLTFQESADFFMKFTCISDYVNTVPPVEEEDWKALKKNGFERSARVEISFLSAKCSDVLLGHNICILHAAAFCDKKYAYLLAAEPGTGKSTQVNTLMNLYPGEFSVICGDRPALEPKEDGTIMVHPTPWNGKEGWGGAPAAPLGALIILRRGEKTMINRLSVRDAIVPTWQALIHTAISEKILCQAAEFATELLSRVPCWEFTNGGIPDSTQVLYHQLLRRDGNDL